MAHFYGTLQGARGKASRLGTVKSGLRTVAASWQGSVRVELYERDGVDFARISLEPWERQGNHVEIYDGPISGAGLKIPAETKAA